MYAREPGAVGAVIPLGHSDRASTCSNEHSGQGALYAWQVNRRELTAAEIQEDLADDGLIDEAAPQPGQSSPSPQVAR